MRYLSVCSGIEAATCAWHPLGWQPVAFSEIDKFPAAVLSTRFPGVPNVGDMQGFKEWDFAGNAIDVLVGGTPCQSFSVAGLRKGLDDPRGNLALVYLAIAERFKPRWLVWENVPGVLSSGRGRDFGAFLGALVKLGYGFAYRVLDAQFFGVPQRRRRVFVVGCLGDWRGPAAVLFERESMRRDLAPRRSSKQEVAKTLRARANSSHCEDYDRFIAGTLNANGKAAGSATQQDAECGLLVAYGGNRTSGPIDVATALRAKGGSGHGDFESETLLACTLPASDGGASSGMHPIVAFDCKAGGNTSFSVGDKAGSLRGAGHGGGHAAVAFQSSQSGVRISNTHATLDAHNGSRRHYGVVAPEAFQCHGSNVGPMGTLRRGHGDVQSGVPFMPIAISGRARGDDGRGYARPEHISEVAGTVDATKPERVLTPHMAVRRLTPRECERLQGFPDDWTLIEYRRKPTADGPRYKAIGNSMAVPVMRWIGERIGLAEAAGSCR